METYSLNPQILPGKPLSEHDHRKVRAALIAVILIAAAIGIAFWLSLLHKSAVVPATDDQAALRARVAALLQQAPAHASQKEIDDVTKLLSSKNTVTDAESQSVAEHLKNN